MTRLTRRFLSALGGTALLLGVYLASALPVAACDCMGPEPMAAYVGVPERVIFTGTVQGPEPGGVPVMVTRWFQGPDAAGIVRLAGTWGMGGASCETPLPPAGTEWLFVAWRQETGALEVSACTPHAALGTDAGQAMLNDAIATFGGVTPEPVEPAAPTEPAGAEGISPVWLVVGGVTLLGLLAGGLLIARSGNDNDPA